MTLVWPQLSEVDQTSAETNVSRLAPMPHCISVVPCQRNAAAATSQLKFCKREYLLPTRAGNRQPVSYHHPRRLHRHHLSPSWRRRHRGQDTYCFFPFISLFIFCLVQTKVSTTSPPCSFVRDSVSSQQHNGLCSSYDCRQDHPRSQ